MKQASVSGYSLLILRIALSGIFIIASINHLLFPDHVLVKLQDSAGFWLISWTDARLMIILSGVFMLVGGLSLSLGLLTRWAAIGLVLILIPITLTVQVGHWSTIGPLFKNIAILGGLIFFIINDAQCCQLGALLKSSFNSKIK